MYLWNTRQTPPVAVWRQPPRRGSSENSFAPRLNIGKPTHNISLPLWGRWIDKAFSRSQDGRGRVLSFFKPLPPRESSAPSPKGKALSKFGASQIDLPLRGQPQAAPSFAARCFAKHRGGNSEPLAKLLTEGVCVYGVHAELPQSPYGDSPLDEGAQKIVLLRCGRPEISV